jgi:2-polyprenyl-6-hydroxyphenyl methylase/3-demethylubiquinone-9 3-methyltransferase
MPIETPFDAAEVAKFDALSHRFWDPAGEFKPLHNLNPLRVEFIAERASLKGARVLDVGCGGGLLAESLAKRGARMTAIDRAAGMIEVARLHAAAGSIAIDYRLQPAEELAEREPAAFDVVSCMEMLEHVPDPGATIDTLAKLCRPGGLIFLSTINRDWRSFLLAIVGAEYVAGLVPKGTPEYERLIRPAEIAAWARAAGLELLELAGLEYNPLTHAATLVKQPKVNYLCALRKPAE